MKRRVLVVVPDLFFATRIDTTAKLLGVETQAVDVSRAAAACRERAPDLVILDLHGPGEPLVLARALKADVATGAIPIVGFYSHVDAALRQAALEAGIDHVMPRSAFTAKLAAILGGSESARADDP